MTHFDADKAARIRAWLFAKRGDESQERLALRISASGWTITRDRYSKYESGALPIGRDVFAHFTAFWGEVPDLTPPAPAPAALDPMERIAAAVEQIARELATLRKEMAGQSGATIGAVQLLGEQLSATLAETRGGR